MGEPTENTTQETKDGFVVIDIGGIEDESEFYGQAHAQVRCYIVSYIPKKTRGKLDDSKYREMEQSIESVILGEMQTPSNPNYYIVDDGVISMESEETTQKGNQYHLYIKSFVVGIDNIN